MTGERKKAMGLTRTTVAIDEELLGRFDAWMTSHGYTNRSEAFRDLIRSTLVQQEWLDAGARVVATLTILYEHTARALAQELTDIQHQDHHAILCSQHVHLERNRCLEVIVLEGTAGQLRRLSDTICATRGVLAGKLTLMSRSV
jgi:CopG family nickel-responsive transcriptional regulator